MARTGPKKITAFIVETNWPASRSSCASTSWDSAGSRTAAPIHNVKVPVENVLWGEGKGLKLALITLNTGGSPFRRESAAGAKARSRDRPQVGERAGPVGPAVGKHDAIAQKIGPNGSGNVRHGGHRRAWVHCSSDREGADIRLEAAMAKLWNTETGWRMMDDLMQIKGGRGYETADSLEPAASVPTRSSGCSGLAHQPDLRRLERDHAAVHRAGSGGHAPLGGRRPDQSEVRRRARRSAPSSSQAGFYALWYPRLWLGWGHWPRYAEFGTSRPTSDS
jgi:alkylation response protein AidB-like acyl-CoA dehydrogenase